ncbi:Ca2-binding protein [Aureococcus anophagefferens]|nr:Ca2-binding protein [Aureococcus anophagefferens]
MKENQQLLAKLNTIHDEAVRRRLERQERARPSGPPLNRLKRAHRARAADQISRENVQILKRLQMLKPNYSAKSFARSRRREEKVIWLRHTDHTAGHLMKAPRGRASRLANSMESLDMGASADAAAPPPEPAGARRDAAAAEPAVPVPVAGEEAKPPPKKRKKKKEAAKKEDFVVKGIGVVQCDVEAKACEPFNILTQLTISCLDEARDVIAERAITISEATLEYGGSEYIAKTDWDDAFDLQELLLKMFQESDDNGNGSLSYDEFYQLMEDADLGLNHSELQLLMSEADENDDQEINYNEFMPVAIDLIQSFKARRYAKRTLDAEDKAVDDEALEKLYGPEIEQSVEAAEALFLLADSRSTGCLTRPEFRRRL